MTPVETELRVTEAGSFFVVRTADSALAAVLPRLGYSASHDEFVRRFPADAPDLDRIYQNFELRIQELLEQAARRRPVPWRHALSELAERLERVGVEWFISGSAALAIRGIDVEPRDIDFVTTEHSAVAEALADALIEPPLRDRDRRWIAASFGRGYLGARASGLRRCIPITTNGARRTRSGRARRDGSSASAGTEDPCCWRRSTFSSP